MRRIYASLQLRRISMKGGRSQTQAPVTQAVAAPCPGHQPAVRALPPRKARCGDTKQRRDHVRESIFVRAFLHLRRSGCVCRSYSVLWRRALGPHRGPWRLAATASKPDQRANQAARAAARSGASTSRAGCPARRRSKVAASAPKRALTSTIFHTDNNQAAAAGALELRVRLTAFAPRGAVDGAARVHVRTRLSATSPGDGADDGGVYGLLGAMPERKSVRDDREAAVVSNRHIDIHVGQADITGNTHAGLLADPRSSPFQREGPGGEHAGSCAGSPVIAEWVEATTAGARTRGDRQCHTKPAQHQDAEQGRSHRQFSGGGKGGEGSCSMRPSV